MNRRIFDFAIAIISAIGAVEVLIEPIITHFGLLDFLPDGSDIIVHIVLLVAVIIAIYFMKRHFSDFYSLLETMALNNKLHTLRACVLVMSKNLNQDYNKFVIDELKVHYNIKNDGRSNCTDNYDVEQTLTFHMTSKRFGKPKYFNCYIISETSPLRLLRSKIYVHEIPKEAGSIIKSPTTYGDSGDRIEDCYGLYNLVTIINKDEYNGKNLTLEVKLNTPKCINPDCEQYNFAIIPLNYGKKIKKITIEIEPNGLDIQQIELQYADKNGHFHNEDKVVKEEEQQAWLGTIAKPRMKTVYFVQLNYSAKVDPAVGQPGNSFCGMTIDGITMESRAQSSEGSAESKTPVKGTDCADPGNANASSEAGSSKQESESKEGKQDADI